MSTLHELPPSPLSLLESLRNLGYSMETAIADIIDNSISADADAINIDFSWNDGNPWLAVTDNGCGMTRTELVRAMRIGSISPLDARSTNDMGRFGLGLKTASFSQCRHLTVLSKKEGVVSCCEWNLDQIRLTGKDVWHLAILDHDDIVQCKLLWSIYQRILGNVEGGTIVLWESMDRISDQKSGTSQDAYFNARIDDARNHLQLVFHRFLSPEEVGRKRVRIFMNLDELVAFNPFNPRNVATQELERQQIILDGSTIVVQPYVLPHHNKVSRQEYEAYAGEGGYLHNQGFYVYRNRRLIIKGTWFRLMKKEELNKLLRVRVDIPNTLDHLWKIDVRKSHASPPETIRHELRQVISRIEISGRRVYRQRGRKLFSTIQSPVWNRVASVGLVHYTVNRDHPLLKELYANLPEEKRAFLENVVLMIESSFPTDMFFHDTANHPETIEQPKLKEQELAMLLDVFITSLGLASQSVGQVMDRLLVIEPFASNRDLTQQILEKRRNNDGQ